jgi:methylmalonyl-CoA epimerase
MPAIDHLGIAVKSLDAAKQLYRALGLEVQAEETIATEQVRSAMLPVGSSRIELMEATAETSPVARFIARRGEGLHHVALRLADLRSTVERMRQAGVRFVSDEIKTIAGGHDYIFVHPGSAGGVLIELCEDRVEKDGS